MTYIPGYIRLAIEEDMKVVEQFLDEQKRKKEKNMKPDWKDAPEWANWLAQDQDGGWHWHEHEPTEDRTIDGCRYWRGRNSQGACAKVLESAGPKEPRPKKDPTVQVLIEKGTGAWEVIINGKLVASGRV